MVVLAPVAGLAQVQLLQVPGQKTSRWKLSALYLPFIMPFKQRQVKLILILILYFIYLFIYILFILGPHLV